MELYPSQRSYEHWERYNWINAMTPPNRFWPFYDDQEVEIYDNPFWDLPGRTRQPGKGDARRQPARKPSLLRKVRVGLHLV